MISPRVAAVASLKFEFENLIKRAMLSVPPHPDHAPQDPSMQQGATPPQQMPQDPAMMQGAAPPQQMPQDPAMMQGSAPPQSAPPQAPPALSGELAAVMDQVVQKIEEQSRAFSAYTQQQEQRMSQLEQQIAQEKQLRDERKKIIDTVLPAM